jgi:hypothetical protein
LFILISFFSARRSLAGRHVASGIAEPWVVATAESREVMFMPQLIGITAFVGIGCLLGAMVTGPSSALLAHSSEAITAAVAEKVPRGPVLRCADRRDPAPGADKPALPNAYMSANGRVFALADLLACARRLHAARFV